MIELTIQRPLVDTVLANTLLHLIHLELYKPRVGIAVSVVLGEEGDSLRLATVGHEKSRRFRDEPDTKQNNDTSECLYDQWNPPRVVVVDLVTAVDHGSRRDGTTKPTAVIEACEKQLARDILDRISIARHLSYQ